MRPLGRPLTTASVLAQSSSGAQGVLLEIHRGQSSSRHHEPRTADSGHSCIHTISLSCTWVWRRPKLLELQQPIRLGACELAVTPTRADGRDLTGSKAEQSGSGNRHHQGKVRWLNNDPGLLAPQRLSPAMVHRHPATMPCLTTGVQHSRGAHHLCRSVVSSARSDG